MVQSLLALVGDEIRYTAHADVAAMKVTVNTCGPFVDNMCG